MKKLIWILSVALLPLRLGTAQIAAPNESGVAMGHIHLVVKDLAAARKFWVTLGGAPIKLEQDEGVKFPGLLVLLQEGQPTAGAAGSIINHFGFHVPNTPEALAKWKAAGLKTEAGANPGTGYVYTPDDMIRIEFLEDKALSLPLEFHHVHFYVAGTGTEGGDPTEKIQAWYAKLLGGKPAKRGAFLTVEIPGASLTILKVDAPTVGTKGRAIDHIGFEVKDLAAFCKKLQADGVKFDRPYSNTAHKGFATAELTDIWGTSIELTEGLNGL